MPPTLITIILKPGGRSVKTLSGASLLEVAGQAGLIIDTPCGGAGSCGKCRVRFTQNPPDPKVSEEKLFSPQELEAGWRLACQTQLETDATVHIPSESIFGGQHQILESSNTQSVAALQPALRMQAVALSPPSMNDNQADLDRLQTATGAFHCDLSLLKELPQRLRAQAYQGIAILTDHHLVDFLPPDQPAKIYAIAFDIGTTTIAGALLNLDSGEEVAIASGMNPQVRFGDDVLSRIQHAAKDTEAAKALQEVLIACLNGLIEELCQQEEVSRTDLYEIVLAGNTTMQHLLCGLNVGQLGQVPFAPVTAQALSCRASDLGLHLHPRALAYVLPVIGSFVGGDIVAGMLCTELGHTQGATLMIDIGTNGELVLAHQGRLWAASTAAGPAFEGARISCGMRAVQGAIEKAHIEEDLQIQVIGDGPATGICGSGLIDIIAELLRHQLITPEGRLANPDTWPETTPFSLRRRLITTEDGSPAFQMGDEASGPALLERDIRELQLANGAIRAGIEILLKQASLTVDGLERVLIAGGFGSFIRRSNAQRIGLIPPELAHHQIRYVGNTALSGAKWVTLSIPMREEAQRLASSTQHVELSNDPDFAMAFALAMRFPDGE